MLVLLLALAVLPLGCLAQEASQRFGYSPNTSGTTPNLLLLFPDQWRSDWDGLTNGSNGQENPLRMPTVRRLASLGTRFTRAIVPSPVCAPSRSCMASGREYDRTAVPDNT
eukprot:5178917-Amphidinium_carterae.1